MCAAPGGKTTAIAILMKDKGEVIAADRSHNKVFNGQYTICNYYCISYNVYNHYVLRPNRQTHIGCWL